MTRPITKRLIDAIGWDFIPDLVTCIDFGIDHVYPNPQYAALQWGFKHECFTEDELDEALGDGSKLTTLVHRSDPHYYTENPYQCTFSTIYDDMPEEE